MLNAATTRISKAILHNLVGFYLPLICLMRFYDVLTVIVMIKPTPHIAIKLYNDIINSHKDAAEAIPTKACNMHYKYTVLGWNDLVKYSQ